MQPIKAPPPAARAYEVTQLGKSDSAARYRLPAKVSFRGQEYAVIYNRLTYGEHGAGPFALTSCDISVSGPGSGIKAAIREKQLAFLLSRDMHKMFAAQSGKDDGKSKSLTD